MKNLTQCEIDQVAGGECPVPTVLLPTVFAMSLYGLFETFYETRHPYLGMGIAAAVGFGFGVSAYLEG